ncbi:hypothetical protein [Agromyces atrinae]|uniref:Uncharacterized protein n=1 Tax=Agromyces atrinae TaxID=592376 RepID=A0A4Q2M1N5_9MICO|nr:hypothetical protein [Agromyces atrinae]NYD68809.1 hypothetical protein [Agromyces atrinae]RXZ85104.1 hypothetical protein ESP50_17185 [Agromyces atrinae]RXZ85815.1 hypothetical protein ESP50_13560 [Agromyces atrinae]
MGFSVLGLVVSLAVILPNLLVLVFPPREGFPSTRIPPILSGVERAGQALCAVVPVITEPGAVHGWWAIPVLVGLVAYYLLWARYLISGRPVTALYGPFWGVPVPMAITPVIVFAATGLGLSNVWVVGSAVVLAAGHIPASLMIARSLAVARRG